MFTSTLALESRCTQSRVSCPPVVRSDKTRFTGAGVFVVVIDDQKLFAKQEAILVSEVIDAHLVRRGAPTTGMQMQQ